MQWISSQKKWIQSMVFALLTTFAGFLCLKQQIPWENLPLSEYEFPRFIEEGIGPLLFVQLLCFFGVLLLFLLLFRSTLSYPVFRRLLGVFFLSFLGVELFLDYELDKLGIALLFLYELLLLAEWTEEKWKKNRQKKVEDCLFWLAPFFAVYVFLLFLSPAPKEAYSWNWFYEACEVVERQMQAASFFLFHNDAVYGMPSSGFSEKGMLLGSLSERMTPVMTIRGRTAQNKDFYLSGRAFDTFENMQWIQTKGGSETEGEMDTLETLYAVLREHSLHESDYLREFNMELQYDKFHTKSIFVPLKTRSIRGLEEPLTYRMEGGNYYMEEGRNDNLAYQVRSYQMNLGNPVFMQLIERELGQDDREIWEKALIRFGLDREEEYSFEKLLEYRELVKNRYCESIRLGDIANQWLSEVTKGAENGYEELLLLEEALLKMEYDINPGELPKQVTDAAGFLEYFLTEQKGYCTHYATAFALLARAKGYPVRYVQGFLAPIGDQATFPIYSNMAHAWPEVYLEGIGWIPFEPTPGFGERRRIGWKTVEEVTKEKEALEQESTEEETLDLEESEEPEDLEEAEELSEESLKALEIARALEEEQKKREAQRRLRLLAAYFAVGILLFAVVGLLLDGILEKIRSRVYTKEQWVRLELSRDLFLLEVLGFRRKESETLGELGKRVNEKRQEENLPAWSMFSLYEKFLYRTGSLEPEEEKILRQERTEAKQMLAKTLRLGYLPALCYLYLMRPRKSV